MEDVFRALADRTRRRLLDELRESSGQSLSELCEGAGMARQSVSKHLAVLEAAGLVFTARRGRKTLHYLNTAPISDLAGAWIGRYRRPEEETTRLSYTAFIRAAPARLWQALTEPELTRLYWRGTEFDTDWRAGSTLILRNAREDVRIVDPGQLVLDCDPYSRLSYLCHRSVDNWDSAPVMTGCLSKFTFEMEDLGTAVKLTIAREGPAQEDLQGPHRYWPLVISNLKTLLETGAVLPEPAPGAELTGPPAPGTGPPA